MKDKMTHRELCFDLALAKGTQYIEVPLGPVWKYNVAMAELKDPGRADVLTIRPSYGRFNVSIYECKVSRTDFLNDIRSKKYKRYFDHCHRLYFALKSGIANKKEIPDGVGLIVRGDNGWAVVKAAQSRDILIPEPTLLALLFYRGRVFSERRELLLNWPFMSGKDKYSGLSKKIQKALRDYDNLSLHFSNLLWDTATQNGCETYDEHCDWIDNWKSEKKIKENAL